MPRGALSDALKRELGALDVPGWSKPGPGAARSGASGPDVQRFESWSRAAWPSFGRHLARAARSIPKGAGPLVPAASSRKRWRKRACPR